MSKINKGERGKNLTRSTKFDTLTFSKNGLLLKYRNEQEVEIPFANLEKIYIKKHKLNPLMELIVILFPFLIVFMAVQYLPFNLMIIVSLISVLPVFLIITNYKWYRLYVRLNDGTCFSKKIAACVKSENFSILEKVRTEYINYNYYESAMSSS